MGDNKKKPFKYEWLDLMVSGNGPKSATTRHILLVLHIHMDNTGYCFPTIATIAKESGRSTSTVKTHITIAKNTDWIKITKAKRPGQGWRRNDYQAVIPYKLRKVGLLQAHQGSDKDKVGRLADEGGAIGPKKVGLQLAPNNQLNNQKNNQGKSEGTPVQGSPDFLKTKTGKPNRFKDGNKPEDFLKASPQVDWDERMKFLRKQAEEIQKQEGS